MKNKKGTSLIELIIYVGIMSIVMVSVTVFLASNGKLERNSRAINEVEFQGSHIASTISQSIRNSTVVSSPIMGSSANSLSLETDIAANNPTVFDISSRKLRIQEGSASPINLNSDSVEVSNISFKNLANVGTKPIIYVQFDVKHLNPGNISELNYQKTFYVSAQQR